MCMVCGFRATTKNKYRELQDHLVRQHFQDRIKSALPTRRPFMCPDDGCKVENLEKDHVKNLITIASLHFPCR